MEKGSRTTDKKATENPITNGRDEKRSIASSLINTFDAVTPGVSREERTPEHVR
jgi:hypothetical protein